MLLGAVVAPSPATSGPSASGSSGPELVGRAVLPVETYAGLPESGAFVVPGPGVINGITFPLPGQPVEGFSAIIRAATMVSSWRCLTTASVARQTPSTS